MKESYLELEEKVRDLEKQVVYWKKACKILLQSFMKMTELNDANFTKFIELKQMLYRVRDRLE